MTKSTLYRCNTAMTERPRGDVSDQKNIAGSVQAAKPENLSGKAAFSRSHIFHLNNGFY